MMQPYMGVYGITKILLEQPCNLELQIYWETHGFLRLESKQWGTTWIPASDKTREEIVVHFPITVNAVVNVQSSCKSPVGITRAGDETQSTLTIVRSGAWTAGTLNVDWQVICK